MLQYPNIDPIALSLGPLNVRWYGLMYLFGFLAGWLLGRRRVATSTVFTQREFDDILTAGLFGVIIGARLGYVLFYDPLFYLAHPQEIFFMQHGGMSFHGGMLGVIFCMWYASRRRGKGFFQTMDFMAPLVPPGLFFGRLGNFINAELWGRTTDVSWGMVFPGGGPLPRHPSKLYEAFLEGLVLFCLLWWFSAKPRPCRAVSGLFLVGYGSFRFIVEFFREPDAHLGFIALNTFSMGQLLCLPMILFGLVLLALAYRKGTGVEAK